MTTDHPVEKLGTKVMNSLDWTVQAFVGARISTEALLQPDAVESILKVLYAKAGWIQEDESNCDNTRQEGWRRSRQPRSRSGYHANNHLGHSAEGGRDVDKTVRTEPQHTFEW